jgi:hypothetical protein
MTFITTFKLTYTNVDGIDGDDVAISESEYDFNELTNESALTDMELNVYDDILSRVWF